MVHFRQPDGNEISGTIAVNPVDPFILLVSVDRDTLKENTLITSSQYPDGRGIVNAVVDPTRYNPIAKLVTIPTGHRFLVLEDVIYNSAGWENADGSSTTIKANSIIEWNGSAWTVIFDPATSIATTYVSNLTTGIQYKWDGIQWLKSFEGEYAPGYWRFDPEGA